MSGKISVGRDARNKTKPHIVRWYGDFDPHTGKQRRYSKSFRLKVEAEQFAAQKTVEFQNGGKRDGRDETKLSKFITNWLDIQKVNLRPETLKLYKNTIVRLFDYFGKDLLISKITPKAAATFISTVKRINSDSNERLSNWTRHRILRNCKTIFQMAVEWDLLIVNPFKGIKRPKCITSNWHYVTPGEFNNLLDVASNLQWQAFIALAYCCGLRKGEILSLTWDNIDFEKNEVIVRNRPATAKLPEFFIKDSESRTIPIPKRCLDILLLPHGEAAEGNPFVVLTESEYKTLLAKWQRFRKQGRSWRNQDIQNNTLKNFKRAVQRAGIKTNDKLSIHTLRKSCITNWANNITNPEVVRVLAGHSDLVTTMKFYSKVDRLQKQRAAAAIDNLLKKADVKSTCESKK